MLRGLVSNEGFGVFLTVVRQVRGLYRIGIGPSFTRADFLDTGYMFRNQTGGGMIITAEVPIYGILIIGPDGGNLGLDPVSISAIAAQ